MTSTACLPLYPTLTHRSTVQSFIFSSCSTPEITQLHPNASIHLPACQLRGLKGGFKGSPLEKPTLFLSVFIPLAFDSRAGARAARLRAWACHASGPPGPHGTGVAWAESGGSGGVDANEVNPWQGHRMGVNDGKMYLSQNFSPGSDVQWSGRIAMFCHVLLIHRSMTMKTVK